MPAVRRVISTPASPEAVWAFLSDFTTTEQWDRPTLSTQRVSGDGGVGTVYENRSRVLGREVPITYTVTGYDAPTRLRLHGEGPSFTAEDTVEVGEHGEGATVRYTSELRLQGATRLAAPLLAAFLRRTADAAAEQMAASFQELADRPG